MTPRDFEEYVRESESDLRESWGSVDRLSAGEAAVLVSSFAATFVKPEYEEQFLEAYSFDQVVPHEYFVNYREGSLLADAATSVRPRLPRNIAVQVHWPVPDMTVAYRIAGPSGEIGRLFVLQGPAIARYAGDRHVAWFLDRDNNVLVLAAK